jgi:hypothetical protein
LLVMLLLQLPPILLMLMMFPFHCKPQPREHQKDGTERSMQQSPN